jgi:predicted dinucleotide-binding enzyme
MKIAVLGTGTVGRTLAAALSEHGHEVTVGTRDPGATLGRGAADPNGYPAWQTAHPRIGLAAFADAAAGAELVVHASSGLAALDVLGAAGAANLAGKVLLDVANPLDFSGGFPPRLVPVDTDSLGEQVQRAFPDAYVVKSLCTVNAAVMVDPAKVGGGEHTIFVSGDDPAAKETVAGLLREFGWRDVLDLGGIETARGQEMMLSNWLRIASAIGTYDFNVKVVR